jgi:DNA-binding LytR/AlgR family response regulator
MKEFPLMMLLPFSFYFVLGAIKGSENPKEAYLHFKSENGKDHLKIRTQDFLYANSSENYIKIGFLTDGSEKEHLIRKPLKKLEQELTSNSEIQRAHRSFLVNKLNIQTIKQEKGKVNLIINGKSIPVSKQFQNSFLN